MKTSKRATQKNVLLNKDFYTIMDIKRMLNSKEICYFEDMIEESYDSEKRFLEDETFRIFLQDGDELKVVLDEDGMYRTALVRNGIIYHITL